MWLSVHRMPAGKAQKMPFEVLVLHVYVCAALFRYRHGERVSFKYLLSNKFIGETASFTGAFGLDALPTHDVALFVSNVPAAGSSFFFYLVLYHFIQ